MGLTETYSQVGVGSRKIRVRPTGREQGGVSLKINEILSKDWRSRKIIFNLLQGGVSLKGMKFDLKINGGAGK